MEIPFSLATTVLNKLMSEAFKEIGLTYGVKKELERLQGTLSTIKAALLDADAKKEKNHLVSDWIVKLKAVVVEMDDVLDECSYDSMHRQFEPTMVKVCGLVTCSNSVSFRNKIAHKIKNIRRKLDDIKDDMSSFNFTERAMDMPSGSGMRRQTHSLEDASKVVGREENKREIIALLMQSIDRETVSIVPIVGIGGLGKTTLARLVYNDQTILSHFQLRMWVCVSDIFDVEVLLKEIIMAATNNDPGNLSMEQLQIRLRTELGTKRFLIVFDDVWNEIKEKWDQLMVVLSKDAVKGCAIVVTTRSHKVTMAMGIDSSYDLKGLEDDMAWHLFEQLAFGEPKEQVNSNLVEIGKRILERCKGVPLAIKTMGSMLQSKDASEWLSIGNNEIWRLPQDESGILPVLKLSYDHLPFYLKQCFAYCSVFPKDTRMKREMLIQLWMAQGYIQSEEVGDQIFNELLLRSFLQEGMKLVSNNVIDCTVHDLIHDLAQSVAGSELSVAYIHKTSNDGNVYHVSFNDSSTEVPRNSTSVKNVRSLFSSSNPNQQSLAIERMDVGSKLDLIFLDFRKLRVLDLSGFDLEEVPCSIGKLKHLRYLKVTSRNIKRLPDSICNLHNLQTLSLKRCPYLKELPRDMRKMICLRNLMINSRRLTHMPSGLGELTSLRILRSFWVEDEKEYPGCGRLRELSDLNELRELEIRQLEFARSESVEANYLKEKQYLENLELRWSDVGADGCGDEESKADERLLKGLQPHPNLKELRVYTYRGVVFPSWMNGSMLPNIVRLRLARCYRCEHLQAFSLESVEYMENNNCTDSVSSSIFFPSLEYLSLWSLPKLKGWRRGEDQQLSIPSFPRLSRLIITRCPELTWLPLCPHLQYLYMYDVSEKLLKQITTSFSLPSKLRSLFLIKVHDLICLLRDLCIKLTSLEKLEIDDCSEFDLSDGDGLRHLTNLQSLEITNCPALVSLPEEMRGLVALRVLLITDCPNLKKRCEEGGEDFHKIAHIPDILIRY